MTVLPPVHTAKPTQEGGTAARVGFNYQDEIALGVFIDKLAGPGLDVAI